LLRLLPRKLFKHIFRVADHSPRTSSASEKPVSGSRT
jgi:hypothetical protein